MAMVDFGGHLVSVPIAIGVSRRKSTSAGYLWTNAQPLADTDPMSEIYLLSTVLMGLLLVVVSMAISRSGQRATPSGHAGGRSDYAEWSGRDAGSSSRLVAIANEPMTWTVSFVVLALVILASAVLALEGLPEGAGVNGGIFQLVLAGVGGAALLGYVFFGAYFAARDRFGQTAAGVAIAALVVGVLMLVGVAATLLTA